MTDEMRVDRRPAAGGAQTKRVGRWIARALALSLVTLGRTGPLDAADDQAARVVLLPSSDRASVVVELDEDVQHTAIHTSDDRTLTVEIGPVKSRVVNQLLQAAASSPLVSQVRVRGITRGSEGTLIALQIVGKESISGSVRTVSRRIYVDLQPLALAAPERPAAESRARRTAAVEPARTTPSKTARPAPEPTKPARTPAPSDLDSPRPARGTAPAPQVARSVPRESPAPVAAEASSQTPPPVAPAQPPANTLITRAEALAQLPDVKGLERLKTEVLANRTVDTDDRSRAATEALMTRLDGLLADARKAQLLADAKLFRGTSTAGSPNPRADPAPPVAAPPAPAAPPPAQAANTTRPTAATPQPEAGGAPAAAGGAAGGFHVAMRLLRPDLERVNGTISGLTPGAVLSGDVPAQIESVLSRLRALQPPGELGSSHERACGALSTLLTGWVRAPNGQWVIAVGSDPTALENTRAAMFDYLRAVDRFDRQG